jgi:glycosyltransferase involved in cell wall biosynthesis
VSDSLPTPKVRVLIYEPYPYGKIAGNLRTLHNLLLLADKTKFEYVIVTPFEGGLSSWAIPLGARVVVLPPPSSVNRYGGAALKDGVRGRAQTILALVGYNVQLSRFLRERKVDVVYSNSIRTTLTIGLAAMLARVPLLMYVKGKLEHGWLDRVALLMSKRILFFSGSNRDEQYPLLRRLLARRIRILEIGIDPSELDRAGPDERKQVRREFNLDRGPVIAYVGQLYAPKGVHDLIDALALLVPDHPDLRLMLIGDPMIEEHTAYERRLRSQVDDLGLEDRVIFTGWREDVPALVAEIDLLVHPSYAEGFGRAVLEAMALGCPVVAAKVGGLRDAIRDGENGFLFDPGDVETMAGRIRQLLDDPGLMARIGVAARKTVFEQYLADDKVRKLEQHWIDLSRAS